MKHVGNFAKTTVSKLSTAAKPVVMENIVTPAKEAAKTQFKNFAADSLGKVKGGITIGIGVGTLLGASKAISNVNTYRKETNPTTNFKPSANLFSAADSQDLMNNAMSACKTVAVTGLENGLTQLKEYGAELKEDGPAALPNIVMRAGLIDAGALVRNVVIDGIGRGTETALTAVGKAGVDAYRDHVSNSPKVDTAAMAGIPLEQATTLDKHINDITKVFAEIPSTGHIMINSTINKIPEQEFQTQLSNIRKQGKKLHYTKLAKQVGENMKGMRELNKDPKMNEYTKLVLQQIVDKKNVNSRGRSF